MKWEVNLLVVAKCVIAVVLTLTVASCDSTLPPILRGASAGGGWASDCPQPANWPKSPEALSPELDARLREQFPPGTPADTLVTNLKGWHFEIAESCSEDPSIKRAHYQEPEGWIVFMPMTANIYWKVGQDGSIVWTKGFVAFAGL